MQDDPWLYRGIPGLLVFFSFALTFVAILRNQPDLSGFSDLLHNIIQSFRPDQYGLPVSAALILLAMALLYFVAVRVFRQSATLAVALAAFAILPIYSGLTHWSHSEQRNHYFGYWFGHDMFTPPFGIYPNMARDAIVFGGTDPGRFVPTYMIFCESFTPDNDKPSFDPAFDRRDCYLITQNALADSTYLQYLRAQYFRSHAAGPAVLSGIAARHRRAQGGLHHQHRGSYCLRFAG